MSPPAKPIPPPPTGAAFKYPAPEFAYFPFKAFRPNPPFLDGGARKPDPWAKRDAWRYNDYFSRANRVKAMVPGLGMATAAFAVYVAYDKWYQTSGPGREENEKWQRWMEEREKRIGGHGHH
ncbi:uncharacterized protein EV422DRAFT_528209 [Fimicolochytrium jonesii]|uniref:uncharacterized protein n=1 Tax=Fimicolochytrium jonesii TaxID=1396493 RepID=UPI0022FECEDC|nr:uncharacterized protein EV422DRAFT_528209 [Fimicolochytrium jonesii]KAI8821460.1 hypothetical protein EV422DRAFT_528209 [Fimicolochytrium jonesii]